MRALILLSLLIFSQKAISQTTPTETQLSQAISVYDEMIAYKAETNDMFGFLEWEDVLILEDYRDEATVLLDSVKQNGNIMQRKAAYFFQTFFDLELGYSYFNIEEDAEAYAILDGLKKDFEYFSKESSFPINYIYKGNNYSYPYTDILPFIGEYYTNIAWVCLAQSFHSEAIGWSRMALSTSSLSNWSKYLNTTHLLEAKKNLGQYDQEAVTSALNQIQIITTLSDEERALIISDGFPTEEFGAKELLINLKKNPQFSENGSIYIQAAGFLKTLGNKLNTRDCYVQMINQGTDNVAYLDEALAFFKPLASSSDPLWKTENDFVKRTAIAAAEKMEQLLKIDSECDYWTNLGNYYNFLEMPDKSFAARESYNKCVKALEKRYKKENRSSNSDYGLYLGVYPFPMIWGNFGAVAQVNLNKISLGFSATKVGHDRDYQSDFYNPIDGEKEFTDPYGNILDREKVYWNGSRMIGTLKLSVGDDADSRGYFSVNIGRVTKTYEPFLTRVIAASNNASVYYGDISPTEVKYMLFLGGGAELEMSKHWILDFGFGIGAAKAKLDLASPYFNNPNYIILSNLIQAAADESIGMSAYLNMSIGYRIFR